MADSPFLKALGSPTIRTAPAQTGELAQRAVEEWERNVCENKAVAILNKMQEGKTILIKKDGGEMLIAIVLDKPLSEAQALVDDPDAFMLEITKIIQNKHAHPVIALLHPDVRDDLPPSECPCLIRRPKQSHCNGGSRAASNAISISAWNTHGWWSNIPPKPVKKRRAQICGQIKRLIKFLQDYASRRVRQTRTSNISAERKSRT